ncbi:MAG TPA: universal stress protein [Exilispira sp.]|nr:universal stress protein [Exilispira sp.]
MKILVPLDFSKTAESVAKYSSNIAKLMNAHVTFYHVIDERNFFTYNTVYTFPEYYPEVKLDEESEKQVKESAEKEFLKMIESFDIKDISYDIKMDIGIPYSQICEFAKENKYDMVIIGSHGKTNLKDIFLGSVVDYISHHIEIPVLIYKVDISKRR